MTLLLSSRDFQTLSIIFDEWEMFMVFHEHEIIFITILYFLLFKLFIEIDI